jgi:hypothetical protein
MGSRAVSFSRRFMTTQDMLTIAILLTMVLVAFLFPGGPGTPRRFTLQRVRSFEN